jgi:hypothetical protein
MPFKQATMLNMHGLQYDQCENKRHNKYDDDSDCDSSEKESSSYY